MAWAREQAHEHLLCGYDDCDLDEVEVCEVVELEGEARDECRTSDRPGPAVSMFALNALPSSAPLAKMRLFFSPGGWVISVLVTSSLSLMGCGKTTSNGDDPGVDAPEDPLSAAEDPLEAAELCMGMQMACALDSMGQTWCWGNVGVGGVSGSPSRHPLLVEGIEGLHGIACGMGRIGGIGAEGRLGFVRSEPSIEWSEDYPSGVAAVAVGQSATCVLDDADLATCWGGQRSAWQIAGAASVHAEEGTACVLALSGKIYCTGEVWWVEGAGDWPSNEPVPLPEVSGAAHLAMNDEMLCIATTEGRVRCWVREIHVDTFVDGDEVPGLSDVVRVAVSAHAVCGLTSAGEVRCSGSNTRGQLGVEGIDHSHQAVTVDLPPVSDIAGSRAGATCAVSQGGHVYCWGNELLTENGSTAVTGDAFSPVVIDLGVAD